jgi:hypothetical protein
MYMKKLKLLITTNFAVSLGLVPAALVAGSAVAATGTPTDIQNATCAGANLQAPTATNAGACENSNQSASTTVTNLVKLAVNIFSWVIGVVAVFAIIYGGFKYITSAGESGGVTSAKNTILYAIIGLVIVALAQVIVRFVLGNVTANTTQ